MELRMGGKGKKTLLWVNQSPTGTTGEGQCAGNIWST